MYLPLFGRNGRLVFEYIELFGVNPLKLKGGKVLRLIKQVKQVADGEAFTYNRKKYRVSKAGVFEGLQVCCNKNFDTPLENHNYLKKVLVSISEREEKERSVEGERKLREKEDGIRERSGSKDASMGKGMSMAEYQRRKKRIDSLGDQVGKEF